MSGRPNSSRAVSDIDFHPSKSCMQRLRYKAIAITGQSMDTWNPSERGGISHHNKFEKTEGVAYNLLGSLTRVDHSLVIAL